MYLQKVLFSAVYHNAMDGTDYYMLWNSGAEDGNVRSECEEDEGTDGEDGDSDTHW